MPSEQSTSGTPPAPAGNFIAFLQRKTGGANLCEIDHALADLVRNVNTLRRPGTLTLKIKISPNSKRGIVISDELSVKAPKADTGESFFFTDELGSLLRNDPNQSELPFQAIPGSQAAGNPAPKQVTA